jgi:hypothetical protein
MGINLRSGGHGSKSVRGRGGDGFEVAVGQQGGGAATRIAPHLPGLTSARGKAMGVNVCVQ